MKKTVSKKVKVSEEHIQELQKNLKKVRTAALKSPTGLLNKVGNLPDKDLIEMVLKVMLRGNSHDVALSTLISHEREKSPKRILSDLKFDMDSLTIPITFSAQGPLF